MIPKEKVLIVIPAGGKGTRLHSLTHDHWQKAATPLQEKTPIEHILDMYQKRGFSHFLILVNHLQDSVKKKLEKYENVHILYSEDPSDLPGKTGALYHAYRKGLLDKAKLLLIHNGADIILNFPDFPTFIIEKHLKQKKLVSIVTLQSPTSLVNMTPIKKNEYHFAVTLLSSEVIQQFPSFFPLSLTPDFEKALFPELIKRNELHTIRIPQKHCFPLKTPEDYKHLQKALWQKS